MTALKTELETTFRTFAGAILSHPSKLTVSLNEDPRGRGCEVAVRPWSHTDKGKLIGGQAETHRAMQIILSAIAYRRGQHCRYLILPSQNEQNDDLTPFCEAPNWKPDAALEILNTVCGHLFADHAASASMDFERGGTLLTVSAPVLNSDATAMIEWALNRLMHAVGNAHGRRLFVNMKATR